MRIALFLLLVLPSLPPKLKPCPFDGQAARFFAERQKDGREECGYSHDYIQPQTGKHFLHVFWSTCD